MIRRATRRRDRGFTLLESFIALVVLAIGMFGLLGLTTVGMRANHLGKRMAEAEELAHDLAEQVEHWDYSDARLVPGSGGLGIVALDSTSITQTPFTASWDLGIADATKYQVQYAENPSESTGNAVTVGALALGKTAYAGVSAGQVQFLSTVDNTYLFRRFWNVYTFNGGKLVQIFVRWKEPALELPPPALPGSSGWRQIAISTFKTPPYLFLGP